MNDPRFWRSVIDTLDASWEATKKRFAKYNKLNEDIMEEKKTKKMTKAEAFEYLKGKKVKCYKVGEHYGVELLKKLAECGCTSNIFLPEGILSVWAIFISDVCNLSILDTAHADRYGNYNFCEISADDILSIEIIEEKYELEFNYDKVVELAKPLMHYLNEVGCGDSIRVGQYSIVHEPMSTLIFDNGIGE